MLVDQADLVRVEPSHLAQQEAVVVLRQVAGLEVREHPGQVDDGVVGVADLRGGLRDGAAQSHGDLHRGHVRVDQRARVVRVDGEEVREMAETAGVELRLLSHEGVEREHAAGILPLDAADLLEDQLLGELPTGAHAPFARGTGGSGGAVGRVDSGADGGAVVRDGRGAGDGVTDGAGA